MQDALLQLKAGPQDVPIVKVDTDLPLLAPERLTAAFIKESFLMPSKPWQYVSGDAGALSYASIVSQLNITSELKMAAVLMPIMQNGLVGEMQARGDEGDEAHGQSCSMLFTQRSAHLKHHAGQVSFPGGRVDKGDAHAIDTALRETQEEVGIAAHQIEVLGTLSPYETGTAFNITPVVGLINQPQALKVCHAEVAYAFTVPLAYLLNPANHRWHEKKACLADGSEQMVKWMSIAYEKDGQSHFIWGATAALLRNFYLYLRSIE